ncbi:MULTISPECIES: hypothetical protein [Streptomyces]|uniref:hypothetical protein n=1 Tax=Streptomyces TaxID=1883 RepID=UPI00225A1C32|nr:hypothetical protein [Streptomyces sp. NBC_00140]MCX5338277.1 hypothetical protein [Streptomyces sp. NBC_00140]
MAARHSAAVVESGEVAGGDRAGLMEPPPVVNSRVPAPASRMAGNTARAAVTAP